MITLISKDGWIKFSDYKPEGQTFRIVEPADRWVSPLMEPDARIQVKHTVRTFRRHTDDVWIEQ